MPYLVNRGVRIHYEVDGQGPPLLLHHGTGGSADSWRENGYREALRGRYRLIMPDSRGHGALRHALHGSVAADLLQNASIPVLVSGPNLELAAHEAAPYRIVATSDGSKASEALLHHLTALGESEGCNVTLLRVHEHEPGKLDDAAAVQLHRDELEAARKLMPESMQVEVVLREIPRGAGVDTAIIEKAQEVEAHAIAMSTQGHSARRHVVIGSVALTLLGRSPVPLLLARAEV